MAIAVATVLIAGGTTAAIVTTTGGSHSDNSLVEAVVCPLSAGPVTDGWAYTASVSQSEGLVVSDLRYGPRLAAHRLSVPYIKAVGFNAKPGHLSPTPESGADLAVNMLAKPTCRSAAVSGSPRPSIGVSAEYRVDDASKDLHFLVEQSYRFDPYVPGMPCEATETAACVRFWPTITWALLPNSTTTNKKVGLEIVQRFDFDPDGLGSGAGVLTGDTPTGNLGQAIQVPVPGIPDVALPFGISISNNGKSNPAGDGAALSSEGRQVALRNGVDASKWENWHQTDRPNVGLPSVEPAEAKVGGLLTGGTAGCTECIHAHWSWFGNMPNSWHGVLSDNLPGVLKDLTNALSPNIPVPSPLDLVNLLACGAVRCWSDGKPEILDGSKQNVTAGWVAYKADEIDPSGLTCPHSAGWPCLIDSGAAGKLDPATTRDVFYWDASTTIAGSPAAGVSIGTQDFEYGDSYWPQLNNLTHGGNGSMFFAPARRLAQATITPQYRAAKVENQSGSTPAGWVLPVVATVNTGDRHGPFYLRVKTTGDAKLLNADPLSNPATDGSPWIEVNQDKLQCPNTVSSGPGPPPVVPPPNSSDRNCTIALPPSTSVQTVASDRVVALAVFSAKPTADNTSFRLDAAPDGVDTYIASDGIWDANPSGMTLAQAQALPHPAVTDPSKPCTGLPAGVLPPVGAPAQISCVAATTVDLDGNGKPDQLVTWSKLIKATGAGDCRPGSLAECDSESGAVAYLDDGGTHVLADPVAKWPGTNGPLGAKNVGPRGTGIVPNGVVQLGSGPRQQVSVTYLEGANTDWEAVLALGADGTLHAVEDPSGATETLFAGGGAQHPIGWGCVISSGTALLAVASTDNAPEGEFAPSGSVWSTSYYQLQDTQLVFRGSRGDYSATVNSGANVGDADCRLSGRRPEIDAVGRGATDPAGAARTLVEAVSENDIRVAEQFTDATLAPQDAAIRGVFHGGDGVDVRDQVQSILKHSGPALVGAPVTCEPLMLGGATTPHRSPPQLCTTSVASHVAASFMVVDTGADPTSKWVVAQALAGTVADVSSSSFAAPSGNIHCYGTGTVPVHITTKLVGDPTIRCFIKVFYADQPNCEVGQVGLLTLDYLGQPGAASCAATVDATAASATRVDYGTAVSVNGIGLCQVNTANVTCRDVTRDHQIIVSRKTITTN